MNTYVTLACLLAVACAVQADPSGYGLGYGGYGLGHGLGAHIIKAPIYAPAISTANLYKAAPIPIVRSVAVAPIISAPIIKTVPILKTVPMVSSVPIVSSYGLGHGLGHGLGGYGLGYGKGLGLGGYGLYGKGHF